MHRIDGFGATAQNLFTEGDPAAAVPATLVTAAWMNDAQEELVKVIEDAGLTLAKGTRDQLRQGLDRLYPQQVNDLATLRGVGGGVNGRVALLKGRDTPDDGGGGLFVWRSGDQSAGVGVDPESGVWIAPNSDPTGASGAWLRLLRAAVNPKWFGAKGDYDPGSATGNDDTTAIQAAIAYVYNAFGFGQVHFDPGNYQVTAPIRTASGIGLIGSQEITRVGTAAVTITKTTSTQSSVQAARSVTSTEIGDGFDGIDHFPNTIIHATSDLVSDGDAQSFSLAGIRLDGGGVCDYGVYARYIGNSYFGYNRVTGCKTGFAFWSFIFITKFEYNYVEECERGYYIDSCTSLTYIGNYARDYADYGHKITRGLYSSFKSNAADKGAYLATATYAKAYFFRNCVGCQVGANGAENLNGTFLHVEQSNGSVFEDNICLGYDLTYTGGDQIEAIKLVTPFAAFRRNTVTFTAPVNKAANHYNVHVSSASSAIAFLWEDSNAFVNDSGGATNVYATLEQGFGQSTMVTFARRAGVNLLGQDMTFYVDTTSGDDQNTGESGSPVKTIQKVIDSLPRPLHVTVTIDVAAGTYAEDLDISGIEGTGRIDIAGAGINSSILDGNQSISNCQVPVNFSGVSITAAGTAQTHIIYNNANGSVHDCEYDTAATGTANQFVRAAGHSRVGVYSNTYTSTTGASIIRADGNHAHIIVDSATASAVGMSAAAAGRISLAGVETSL